MRRTIFLVAVFALFAAAAAGAARAASPPPPLTGELLGDFSSGTASGHCDPASASPLSWDVSGTAVGFSDEPPYRVPGPYSGTFQQRGNAVMGRIPTGPLPDFGPPPAPLLGFSAQFTIDSPAGQVSGVTTLDPAMADLSYGQCVPGDEFLTVSAFVRYRATIRADGWLCLTSGHGAEAVNALIGRSADTGLGFETTDSFDCHPLP